MPSALFVVVMLVVGTFPVLADDKSPPRVDCSDPLQSAPTAVKQALGNLYRIEPSAAQLNAASVALKDLMSAASYCRIEAQSPSAHADARADRDLTREWLSLHMWINRIADFVYLNAKGRTHVNWKQEYADFAALYEIEA
ncbi:MAG: hypothetical protein ACU85U_03290 [Gammaproteobacteria bacterium]|jgi:hypothetical protein